MALTTTQHEIAASIDKEVSMYPDTAGGMEQLQQSALAARLT